MNVSSLGRKLSDSLSRLCVILAENAGFLSMVDGDLVHSYLWRVGGASEPETLAGATGESEMVPPVPSGRLDGESVQTLDELLSRTAWKPMRSLVANWVPSRGGMCGLTVAVAMGNRHLEERVRECLRELGANILSDEQIRDWYDFLLKFERAEIDVFFTDLTGSALDEAIRGTRKSSWAWIVAVQDTGDPDAILAAVRAGARECLYPPLEVGLRRVLERASAERAKRGLRVGALGRTLGFLSSKGGSGATTVACHVAMELQRITDEDTLLVDFDPDMGIVGFLMKASTPYTLLDALQNIHRLDLSYWKALVWPGQPHLDVLPSVTSAGAKTRLDGARLVEVLRFARSHYARVVADLGRGLTQLTLKVLEEIDELFLVSDATVPGLYQTKRVLEDLFRLGCTGDRIHLIVNRQRKEFPLRGDDVERLLGVPMRASLPDASGELLEAYASGALISPKTALGRGFARLAAGIAGMKTGADVRSPLLSRLAWEASFRTG